MRVLEIGGGDGYQASKIATLGCDVVSIDVNPPVSDRKRYYPVYKYDGVEIPYPNSSFDLVFSSHTLEHVKHLVKFLAEIHRVLSPSGTAIHILPSVVWRAWTSVAHYGYVVLRIAGINRQIPGGRTPSVAVKMRQRGIAHVVRRVLFAGPHGKYPNAIVELYTFSRARWSKVFRANNFDILEAKGTGVFYTGYGFFRWLSVAARRRTANILGSGSNFFAMRPRFTK